MNRRAIAAATTLVATALTPALLAAPAQAASGKSSIYDCTNRTITANRQTMTVKCNTPGTQYRFEVACGYYSAGQGGTVWKSSAWTTDGRTATVTCGGNSAIAGVGSTVYYR